MFTVTTHKQHSCDQFQEVRPAYVLWLTHTQECKGLTSDQAIQMQGTCSINKLLVCIHYSMATLSKFGHHQASFFLLTYCKIQS